MGGGGARLSEFFSKNPNRIKRIQILKKNKNCLFVDGGGEARGSEFFYKELKSKKNLFFFCRGGGRGWGVDGWTVEQAHTNLPLQLL